METRKGRASQTTGMASAKVLRRDGIGGVWRGSQQVGGAEWAGGGEGGPAKARSGHRAEVE